MPSGPSKLLYENILLSGSQKARRGFAASIVIAIAAVWTALYALVSLRVLPPIDGALFPLSNGSWFPYRDYYFPTTPGSYFIARIAGYGSNEHALLNFRLIGLSFAPLFFWSLYRLSRLNLPRFQSVVMASFGMSVMYKMGIEVLGGWNLIPLILFSTAFTLIITAKSKQTLSARRINQTSLRFLAAGACFGFSMVFKHTFTIQAFMAFALYLTLISLLVGFGSVKKLVTSTDFRWMTLGLLIPLSLTSYWMFSNSLVQPFLNNIAAMGGKNPQALVLIQAVFEAFINSLGNPIALALIGILIVGAALWQVNLQFEIGSQIAAIFLFAFLSETLFISRLSPTANVLITLYFIIFVTIALNTIRNVGGIARFKVVVANGIFIGFGIQLIALVIQAKESQEKFAVLGLADLVYVDLTFILCIAFIAFYLAKYKLSQLASHDDTIELKLNIFVFTIAISSMINLASSGGGVYLIWMIGPFTWLFARALTQLQLERKFVDFGIAVVLATTLANVSFGFSNPYTWHNWKEPSLAGKARSSELPGLVGILPATEVSDFYEKLKKIESRAANLSNSEDPKIFTLGGIPMASAISGLSPYEHTYCKFQWMDLCPQNILLNDLEAIKSKSPDVIVIEEISDPVMSLHELGFLKETSEIRKYYTYAYSQVRKGNWVKAGTVRTLNDSLVASVYYSTE